MRLLGWAAAAFLLLVPSIGSSKTVSATTGALNGRVTDNSGAVLPGLTITISSPSLMARAAVTGAEGDCPDAERSSQNLCADLT